MNSLQNMITSNDNNVEELNKVQNEEQIDNNLKESKEEPIHDMNNDNINYLYNDNNNKEPRLVTNNNTKEKNPKKEEIKEDIIDELINKIKANEKITPQKNYKQTLDDLDQEMKLGLEKIKSINSNRNLFSAKKVETNNSKVNKNYKYNELLQEINKNFKYSKENKEPKYKEGTFLEFKNIKIMNPNTYFKNEKRLFSNEGKRNKSKGYYYSSIDGKAIINGERKEMSSNNFYRNKRNSNSYIRMNSVDKGYNDNKVVENKFRRINCYNKDYFNEELKIINELLFSKS